MGWTIEDEIEIEPFAMAERKDNDPCPSLQDGGGQVLIAHFAAGRTPNNRSFYLSPKDLITFASN